jgi:perosamine synthetase
MDSNTLTILSDTITPKITIPVYKPYLNGKEKEYVIECLDSKWISSKGDFVHRFEKEFSNYLNIGFSTTVSNGTVALHLALLALGIKAGDEVIVPTFTYIASVNAIQYVGANPVFVDSENQHWNINPDKIVGKITSKTKAILAVHMYGAPCELDKIAQICKLYNLFLIEDVAEAFGSKYKGKFTGSFGDISTFSFFGNKTITTGEGGMVVSNNKSLIDRVSFLKAQSVSATKEYWHDEIGYNYRMTNICAAIGLAQLEQVDTIIKRKREIAQLYKSELGCCPFSFQEDSEVSYNTYWMVSFTVSDKSTRDTIRTRLLKEGIETRPFFHPAHKMPTFRNNESFLVAETLSETGLNLPSYPDLKDEEIKQICNIIKSI